MQPRRALRPRDKFVLVIAAKDRPERAHRTPDDDCSGRSPDLRVDALFPPSRTTNCPVASWKKNSPPTVAGAVADLAKPYRIPISLVFRPANLNAAIIDVIVELSTRPRRAGAGEASECAPPLAAFSEPPIARLPSGWVQPKTYDLIEVGGFDPDQTLTRLKFEPILGFFTDRPTFGSARLRTLGETHAAAAIDCASRWRGSNMAAEGARATAGEDEARRRADDRRRE